ncbi:hypothetical protein PG993_003826 [Apiospora rasikravindrae]|uniref:Uncharacterized protein n=1 Tax=Apiospora rasikravindrae TaxID=990691 RepID=A0ABR1U0M2_9PEZI
MPSTTKTQLVNEYAHQVSAGYSCIIWPHCWNHEELDIHFEQGQMGCRSRVISIKKDNRQNERSIATSTMVGQGKTPRFNWTGQARLGLLLAITKHANPTPNQWLDIKIP